MKITIEIDTSGAAFEDMPSSALQFVLMNAMSLAEVLYKRICRHHAPTRLETEEQANIIDNYGNTCGFVRVDHN